MLNTPDDFLVFHVPGNGFQDELLHCVPMDQDEADQLVVPSLAVSLVPT